MSSTADTTDQARAFALTERFESRYGLKPRMFRAPGRVNLIGEHTDYNDGFVMPAAIELYAWVAVGPRSDKVLRVCSEQFGEERQLRIDALAGPPTKHWTDYVRGIAAKLLAEHHSLPGADLMISGELPLGAGLSSSAAIEVSTALALSSVAGIDLPPLRLALLCQSAEQEFAGTRCGIMDQFISLFGKAAHCVMLDCRSLDYHLLPIPGNVRLVICNSETRHEHAAGEYNRRREECELGVASIRRHDPKVLALRDVTGELLEQCKSDLPEVVYRRCRHVVTENERVLQAGAALRSGDLKRFGELIYESHASLRDDYEVSCKELNVLVDIASNIGGVYGARMTGGGFGGCTINLVASDAVSQFGNVVRRKYHERTGISPEIYVCSAAPGAGPVGL